MKNGLSLAQLLKEAAVFNVVALQTFSVIPAARLLFADVLPVLLTMFVLLLLLTAVDE